MEVVVVMMTHTIEKEDRQTDYLEISYLTNHAGLIDSLIWLLSEFFVVIRGSISVSH